MIRFTLLSTVFCAYAIGVLFCQSATAGAMQLTQALMLLDVNDDSVFDEQDTDIDLAFGLTSSEVMGTTTADVDGSTAGSNYDYTFDAAAAVTDFGGVELSALLTGNGPNTSIDLLSAAIVMTDEYANASNIAQHVSARVAVNPATIELDDAVNSLAAYQVVLLADNLGNVDATEDENDLLDLLGGDINDFDVFEMGTAIVQTDAAGNASFAETGFDLGGSYDPAERLLEVPFSVQHFELGTLEPGDRMVIAAFAAVQLTMGSGDSMTAQVSGGPSTTPLLDVRLAPVPEPASCLLLATGPLLMMAVGRRRSPRRGC